MLTTEEQRRRRTFAFGSRDRLFVAGNEPGAPSFTAVGASSAQLRHPVIRLLVLESGATFRRLQASRLSRLEAAGAGLELASILRGAVQGLASDGSATLLLSVLEGQELLLSLAQLLFLPAAPAPPLSARLGTWGRWNFTAPDAILAKLLEEGPKETLHRHPKFWPLMRLLVAFGRLAEAAELLRSHPSSGGDAAFRSLEELLDKCPLGWEEEHLDTVSLDSWRAELERRVSKAHFQAYPELGALAELMLGSPSELEWLVSRGLVGSWPELLIPLFLYSDPTLPQAHLANIAQRALSLCPPPMEGKAHRPVDSILLAFLHNDILGGLAVLAERSVDWWLPAHLGSLLSQAGALAPQSKDAGELLRGRSASGGSAESASVVRFLVRSYAGSLAGAGYWELAAAYLDSQPEEEQAIEDLLLASAAAASSHHAKSKVLSAAQSRGLSRVVRSICAMECGAALKTNQVAVAIGWAVQSQDAELLERVSQAGLREMAVGLGTSSVALLAELAEALELSPRLLFLCEFARLRRLGAQGETKEAGQLLLRLLASPSAPAFTWLALLEDARRLVQQKWAVGNAEAEQLLAFVDRIGDQMSEIRKESGLAPEVIKAKVDSARFEFIMAAAA